MSTTQGSNNRQRQKGCSVRLNEKEQKILKEKADLVGYSLARFMREVSLGKNIQTRETKKLLQI